MPKRPWNASLTGAALAGSALLALALAAGCAANSTMTNLWHDPAMAPGSMKHVLVVAIRKDAVRRRAWEDAYVGGLERHGVSATASYRQFPAAVPDTDDVIATVRRNGYDAVLTSARLADEETNYWVAGAVRPEQVSSRDYYGNFHTRWVMLQAPGYTETDTYIRVQTDIWTTAVQPGRLVWSGTLRTLETANGRIADHAVSREILPLMEKQGVLPARSR